MGNSCGACFAGLTPRPNIVLQPEPDSRLANRPGRRFDLNKQDDVDAVLASRASRRGVPTAPISPKFWCSPVPRSNIVKAAPSLDHRRPDSLSKRSKYEIEQLVMSPGTLPKPMAIHEREQVIRKLLPTATHEMLARIPQHLLESNGMEAQALRRRLACGSTVVFFTAGYPGKRFVLERAHELGIRVVVLEHPDSWARGLVDEGLIAKFIPVDMNRSAEEILAESLDLIKGLGSDGLTGEADAVCTVVELSVPLVARLCEALGLPGPSPESVDVARDKHRTRAALKEHGLPTPRNILIRCEEDIAKAAAHVGFPAVLKPVSGAASLGVKKVVAQADLLSSYREVVTELRSLVVVSGALEQRGGAGSADRGVQADTLVDLTVLLEQYLDGDEVDIDVVFSEGEWRYAGLTDNGPTLEPYFNETWGVCPSLLPLDTQRGLKELAVDSVKAIGFTSGVFHVECKQTSTGPQLIEVNARMGGGPVYEVNRLTWGVDLVEEAIFCALGIPSRPFVPEKPLTATAYYMVPAEVSGVVDEMPDLQKCSKNPAVVHARPLVKVGQHIVGPAEGFPTWVMDLLVTKPSAVEARNYVWDLKRENRIQIKGQARVGGC